jgi:putative ABC transport system substrate-binding protein
MINAAWQHLRLSQPNDSIELYGGGFYANDDLGVLEDYADKLVNESNVPVIVAAGGPQSAISAMDATAEADLNARRTVPIVFTTVTDPEGLGLVDRLDRPGRHLTGMAGQTSEKDTERLQLLHEFVSTQRAGRNVGILINPSRQGNRKQYRRLKREARTLGLVPVARRANNERGIERAFLQFRHPSFLGVVVTADSFFNNNRDKVIAEAARDDGIPAIYQWREFVDEHGLISFGPSIRQAYEEAGRYVARILLGERPAQMPCSVPDATTFEVFVKTATARSLQLNVPPTLGGRTVNEI